MTREEINKLADRVESLTGPDREVDWAIHAATHPKPDLSLPRDYTRSLDAAMSLVPEGMHPSVSKNVRSDIWRAWVVTTTYDKFRKPIYNHKDATEAATHALALTAAALRARAEVLP
jgi:hypothetical protein